MNNRFMIGCLVVMLFGFALCGAPAAWAVPETAAAPADRASAVTEVDGKVVSVDVVNHRLKLKDTHEEVVTLQVVRETVISSPASSKLVLKDLKPNDKVHAYYTTADRKARQIDVSPVLPVIRDLETR